MRPHFSDNGRMTEMPAWKCAKWPFIATALILLGLGFALVWKTPHQVPGSEMWLIVGCVIIGALIACLPFYLDWHAAGNLIEVHAVGEVTEKIHDLQRVATQVSVATDRWARVQETTKDNSEKTVAASAELAERMANEVREFNQFQAKMNDAEKGALRLETEKLRRAEGEWLQVVVRMLDHTFALHTAAVHTGQPELIGQISNFQNACRDAARRVGLVPFGAEAGEKFDAEKHRAHGVENPSADSTMVELLAPGINFQGRLMRPALVRLQTPALAGKIADPEEPETSAAVPANDELPL